MLSHPGILPESVEPAYSDNAQRYNHLGLPSFQPRYITDDFDLVRRLVDKTDAYLPLTHTSPPFAGPERDFLMIRDVVEMPDH